MSIDKISSNFLFGLTFFFRIFLGNKIFLYYDEQILRCTLTTIWRAERFFATFLATHERAEREKIFFPESGWNF